MSYPLTPEPSGSSSDRSPPRPWSPTPRPSAWAQGEARETLTPSHLYPSDSDLSRSRGVPSESPIPTGTRWSPMPQHLPVPGRLLRRNHSPVPRLGAPRLRGWTKTVGGGVPFVGIITSADVPAPTSVPAFSGINGVTTWDTRHRCV